MERRMEAVPHGCYLAEKMTYKLNHPECQKYGVKVHPCSRVTN